MNEAVEEERSQVRLGWVGRGVVSTAIAGFLMVNFLDVLPPFGNPNEIIQMPRNCK